MTELSPYSIRRLGSEPRATLPPTSKLEEGLGLYDCWRVIRRHLRLICGLFLGGVLLSAIVVWTATPNFTASSTLLIEDEAPHLLDIRELIGPSQSTEDHDYYKTQFELLRSRTLAARVIAELDLGSEPLFQPPPPPRNLLERWSREAHELLWRLLHPGAPSPLAGAGRRDEIDSRLVEAYLTRLKVIPVAGTRLVTVSFRAPERELATRIVNTHVRDYMKWGLERITESRSGARKYLEKELIQLKQQVQSAEAALNTYRHQKGIVSFDSENKNSVAQERMISLTKALTEAETRRINAQAQMVLVKAGDYESLPQVVANPTIAALKPQVERLQADDAAMAAAFNPAYPKLVELKSQLDAASAALTHEVSKVARAVQREYAAASEQERELQDEVAAEKERDLALNDASLRDAVLAREVATTRQLYQSVLQRMQELAVGERAPVSNLSIVESAALPMMPSSPQVLRDLALGATLGLLAGIVLAFLLDQLDNRLKTADEVERYLHLPNLAIAPDFARLKRRTPFNLIGRDPQLPATRQSKGRKNTEATADYLSGRNETYRAIRTALTFSRAGAPPRTLLITSAVEGEGKTYTAVNTARAFAQTGAATLLIDADLRRPRCHHVLDTHNSAGLGEVLAGQCDPHETVRQLADQKLYLLSAGSPVPNPAELLTSAKMMATLHALSKLYELIVMDSAPLMYASDTIGLATMADGVVFVAGARTSKHSVRRACQRLAAAGVKILGVVLNRVDVRNPDYQDDQRFYFSYEPYAAADAATDTQRAKART